jgi:hypothetical protein
LAIPVVDALGLQDTLNDLAKDSDPNNTPWCHREYVLLVNWSQFLAHAVEGKPKCCKLYTRDTDPVYIMGCVQREDDAIFLGTFKPEPTPRSRNRYLGYQGA